jgi:OPA family sugar phosphate sensor protein UhpC-like MFS transporter
MPASTFFAQLTPRSEYRYHLRRRHDAASCMSTSEARPRNRVYERWRWQIFGITWLAYAGLYLTRKSFSVAKVAIGEGSSIGLTRPDMAWIDGAYNAAYAIGQIIWGIGGDRFGPRHIVALGIFSSVLFAFGMGSSSVAIAFAAWALLQGLAQSTGWGPLAKNLSSFFSQRERGMAMGIWCTNYAVGGFVATLLAGAVGQKFGWRYAFFIPAAGLFVIGILFLFLQRNRPEDVGLPAIERYHGELEAVVQKGDRPVDEPEGTWKVIGEVARNRMVLLLCVVYFCLKPTRYAVLLWGPLYVHDRLGTGMKDSGLLSAMFELAGPLSVFLGGLLSDKVFGSRRMPVSVICLFLLGGLLLFLDHLPRTGWMLGASLFLLGFLTYAPDSLVSGTAAVDFGTKRGASTASGLINGCGSVGQILGGSIPGFFQKQWGWNGVFLSLAIAVFVAAVLLLPKWNALPQSAANTNRR